MKDKSRDRNRVRGSTDERSVSLTRRRIVAAAGAGLVTSGLPLLMTAGNAAAQGSASALPDLAAARKEGPLLLWHGDQEGDVVEYIKGFTQKTGIEVVQQRLLPGCHSGPAHAQTR